MNIRQYQVGFGPLNWLWVLVALLCLGTVQSVRAVDSDHCFICGKLFEIKVYMVEDRVTHDKKRFCPTCSELPQCYLCGLPTANDRVILPDDRVLCLRDSKLAVVDEKEALGICDDVKTSLDRHFSRFTSFPEKNLTIYVIDRVNLIALFKIPGNDFGCPNILGYTSPVTNEFGRGYEVNVLSGMVKSDLKATCAHELAHTWIFENVSKERQKQMSPDAREGFCELVSYLLMQAQGETVATQMIRSNGYTRGHIDLFIEAESRYGFNDVVDWMKFGEDRQLFGNDLGRIRQLRSPTKSSPTAAPATVARAFTPPPPPDRMILQGVTWSKTRPMAMINGRTFFTNEEAKIPLGAGTVSVKVLAIRQDEVEVQVSGAAERQTLRLKDR